MTTFAFNHPKRRRHYNRKPVINNLLNEFFNSSLNDLIGSDVENTTPAVNVFETKDSHRLEVAAPGFIKSDFNINIDKDTLTISTAAKEEKAEEETVVNKETENEEKILRREFHYGSFKRSFTLPETINTEGITAKYENGILVVELPKKEEAKEVPPRNVAIN